MDNFDRNDLIESYLSGTLSPDDQKVVETRIANDPEFRAEVELQRQLHEELADGQKLQLRDLMADISREVPPAPAKNNLLKRLGIAIAILLVGWFAWWVFSTQEAIPAAPGTPEEIKPAPATPLPDQTLLEVPPEVVEKTPEKPVAMSNPAAFAPNRTFEDRLGSPVRATGGSAEMQSPAPGANFKAVNGLVSITFRGTAPADADTAQYPMAIKIYTNVPAAPQPRLRLFPTIENRNTATGKWTFSATLKQRLNPGLYYYVLERQVEDDLIFVGKFTVGGQ